MEDVGKAKHGSSTPVWIAATVLKSRVDTSTSERHGKASRKAVRSVARLQSRQGADKQQEEQILGKAASSETQDPTAAAAGGSPVAERGIEVTSLHVIPSTEKIVRAAANQSGILKKRDMDTARVYLVIAANGEVLEPPQEIALQSRCDATLAGDGAAVVITAGNQLVDDMHREVIQALERARDAILQKKAELEDSRAERQNVRASVNPEDKAPVLFWKDTDKNGYLSNWATSPFQLNGQRFNCAEQYIMWSKAVAMGDEATREQIMATKEPRRQKALGRQVQPWKERIWAQRREPVMLEAARAKFQQNPALADRLLKTDLRPLAEASPSDKIYGIGLAPDNPLAQDPRNWKGENLLGRILEQVREELRLCSCDSECDASETGRERENTSVSNVEAT